jgi:4-hydroxy-2-oxoheptanedioate aldolase
VPWNEPGIIGKSLDAGARGIIIPMVNSPEEARAAVAACRYAPLGKRSYGPLRANTHYGPDYFANANTDIICLVMIETRQAVEQVDAILSTPGSTRFTSGRPI